MSELLPADQAAPATVPLYRIFLSSPGDVSEERNLARELIKEHLPYLPALRGRVSFEVVAWDDPAVHIPMLATETPQESVNRSRPRPATCQITIVILWSRMGTPLPEGIKKPNGEPYASGTEWEYEDACNSTFNLKPKVLVYRRTEDFKVSVKDPEKKEKEEQFQRVEKFFEQFVKPDGSLLGVTHYDTPATFRDLLRKDLEEMMYREIESMGAARPICPSVRIERTKYFTDHRQWLLEHVRRDWIDGIRNKSIYEVARIELGLVDRPEAVRERLNLDVPVPDRTPVPMRSHIGKVFDDRSKALLILGGPGAGKTTLLLELAEELLDRATQDDNEPVPVVFHLSSWAKRRLPLLQWLTANLNDYISVPEEVAQKWFEGREIIPLLDGLDTVAIKHRDACVKAVDTFHREHLGLPIAVCSRKADYEALGTQLQLPCAVEIQLLTQDQVADYLQRVGEPMKAVRAALETDPSLWKVLDTPLMLCVAMLAYKDAPDSPPPGLSSEDSLEGRSNRLFAKFVDEMLKRPRTVALSYTAEKTRHWLSALASALDKNHETVFYLEDVRPAWLPAPFQRWLSIGGTVLGAGLLIGLFLGLIDGLIIGFNRGPLAGLVQGAEVALWFGWFYVVVCALLIWPIEKISIDLMGISRLRRAIIVGLTVWTIFGLIVGYIDGPIAGVVEGVIVGFFVGLANWLRPQPKEKRRFPNQATHDSAKVALATVLIIAFIAGPVVWMLAGKYPPGSGRYNWLFPGLIVGLIGGLVFGGLFCIRHFVSRLVLWMSRGAPVNYVRFLDYAVDRLFLRRDGGGYIFLHPMLAKHFSSLWTAGAGCDETASGRNNSP